MLKSLAENMHCEKIIQKKFLKVSGFLAVYP